MSQRLAGLILAGGQARRMSGIDKPLLEIGGRTILAATIEALDLPDIAISANGDPARFAAYGLPILPDEEFAGQGPLAGLLAGLRWAARHGFAILVSVPGDMPFLPRGFARSLLPAPCAAKQGGQRHHLVASWPTGAEPLLRSFLAHQESRRVADFAAVIRSRDNEFPVLPPHNFANINELTQLEQARRFACSTGSK